jgi:LPXTG-motif cell wall-anchored protein
MNLFKTATIGFCLALLGATFSPSASGAEWDRKTVMTFSGPVEIPGVHLKGYSVLPAGTYVFKILDSQSNRHIVQIFDKDETKVYATILAIPNYRLKATDKTVITFSERPAGQPEALRAWFYPGRNWGEEFVYPKAKALEIAKTTNQVVLFTPDDIEQEVEEPIHSATEPRVVELKKAPVMAIKPTGEQVELAQVVTPPPPAELTSSPAPVQMAQNRPASLPNTGSPLPLAGLFGLLALGGAAVVRFAQKRLR